MFGQRRNSSAARSAITLAEVTYHATVRNVQNAHGNAIFALFLSLLQTALLVIFFYVIFTVFGIRGAAVRGDFVLYLISGVFLYLTHIKTVSAVVGAEAAASGIMQHAPMNSIVSVCSAAFGVLYTQIMALTLVLFIYHAAVSPIVIDQWPGAFACVFMTWAFGVSVGLILYAIKPWFPKFVQIFTMIYTRANMIASGKMFLANHLGGFMLAAFSWNPLFHLIDQTRGFTFINYNPHFTSMSYPVTATIALLMIGMMGEFYTRRHSSLSWNARR